MKSIDYKGRINENFVDSMRKPLLALFAAIPLFAPGTFAQNHDDYSFLSHLPSDCDEVRAMKNIKTGKMEYFYVLTCNRAGFSLFSKLNKVKKVKRNVIYIPNQKLGDSGNFRGRNISGHYCSKLLKSSATRKWSCTAKGWTPHH